MPRSSATATPDSNRAVLRLARVRVSADVRRGNIPAALPCTNYYDVYADEIGPMGNVEVNDAEEMRRWRLIARPVTPEVAAKTGGCIVYKPCSSAGGAVGKEDVQFYCITDSDDDVYGRAVYLPQPPRRRSNELKRASVLFSSCSSSADGCSAEGEDEDFASLTSPVEVPRRRWSCRVA